MWLFSNYFWFAFDTSTLETDDQSHDAKVTVISNCEYDIQIKSSFLFLSFIIVISLGYVTNILKRVASVV